MYQPPKYSETRASAKAAYDITQTFLKKQVLIKVTDGRYFQGQFVCVDHECNIILQSAHQYQNEEGDGKKWFGMVMIPGKHMLEIEVKANWSAAFSKEASLYI
jgi:small nuclear ribonucleoprotein (snRNP)-like protein